VALGAVGRELKLRVVRLSGLELFGVATVTISGHGGVVTQPTILMAGIAFDGGVRAQQRKAVVVILDLLRLNLPASDGMALFTIRPEFAAVKVGVAFCAQVADVGEDWLGMALRAGYALVKAPQWEARGVVIKLGDSADWLPTFERVAVLTGNIQGAVRAAGCKG
jgi:hypothetical protein